MKDNEFLDKILDQLIEEASTIYVENEYDENQKIEDEDVEFSDIHKQKMKEIFKKVRKEDNRIKIVKITKKVAIILLCAMLITCGLITTVDAWRKEVIKFIMKNDDDNYMSINFGDTSYTSGDDEENQENEETNQFIVDDIKFLYLPEGFEFDKEKNIGNYVLYNFEKNNKYIRLKKYQAKDKYVLDFDIENASSEKIALGDKEVFKILKDDRINYIWYSENYMYEVISNISNYETLKFIENIKILKNF